MHIYFSATVKVKVQSAITSVWSISNALVIIPRQPKHVVQPGLRWYILRVDGAYEKKAALALHVFGAAGRVPDFELIRQLWIPQSVIDYTNPSGKLIKKNVVLIPGYLFVEAILSYRLYASLRRPDLPHIYGWLQPEKSWPSTIDFDEVRHLATIDLETESTIDFMPFEVGDRVKVPGGVIGEISEISEVKLIVSIEMFGRRVDVEVRRRLFSELVKQL